MFLKNAWYVAAWASEITSELRQITVLGENICVFRTSEGNPVGLEDACPHRKLPLSRGRLKDGNVECGYHGLTFDCSGQCVWAPGTGRIPGNIGVHSYPLHEKYDLVWIWMGDPEKADADTIFEIPHYGDPAWGINRGAAMDLQCNYLLMTDNLLDSTHVATVHPGSFGEASTRDTPLHVNVMDDGVIVHRWMMNVEPAPFYKQVVGFDGKCDRLQQWEVYFPSHALIKAVFTPVGTGGPDGGLHEEVFIMDSYNFMTPINETETRYYWFQLRNIRPDDVQLSELMSDGVRAAFEEDRAVLAEVQKGLANERTPHINLPIDKGQLRYRQKLNSLIERERCTDLR